ncbi:MAG: hypothetical protein OER80_12995 [Gammaproteobacteria bacterium]|nr:hypothetical protein [Gammaproteobacteria bacterium]MDH3768369.1 hypothetical protein [Gammaproteobacteria bacterium]
MSSSENTDPGRIRSGGERVYGIRMTLPENDSFRLVLGDDWASFRWYATEAERDEALADMRREHEYSRLGDIPTLIYERVERDKPPAPLQRPAA